MPRGVKMTCFYQTDTSEVKKKLLKIREYLEFHLYNFMRVRVKNDGRNVSLF